MEVIFEIAAGLGRSSGLPSSEPRGVGRLAPAGGEADWALAGLGDDHSARCVLPGTLYTWLMFP